MITVVVSETHLDTSSFVAAWPVWGMLALAIVGLIAQARRKPSPAEIMMHRCIYHNGETWIYALADRNGNTVTIGHAPTHTDAVQLLADTTSHLDPIEQ